MMDHIIVPGIELSKKVVEQLIYRLWLKLGIIQSQKLENFKGFDLLERFRFSLANFDFSNIDIVEIKLWLLFSDLSMYRCGINGFENVINEIIFSKRLIFERDFYVEERQKFIDEIPLLEKSLTKIIVQPKQIESLSTSLYEKICNSIKHFVGI
jgi:hypothetical protein